MTTVREALLEMCRAHDLTTWFGNPGSSELTLLQDFPDDLRYVLGLQEMIPVGMARSPGSGQADHDRCRRTGT
jgi:benzoylformate decarboxylase